ncbi:hypothetical protein ACHAXT_008282 [Thalassiosira profunda]
MGTNLRRRRKPSTTAAEAPARRAKRDAAAPSATAPRSDEDRPRRTSAATTLLFFALYVPVLFVANPTTVPNLYHALFPAPCVGICTLGDIDGGGAATTPACRPANPSRLALLRIPKTGSTTMVSLFDSRKGDKSTSIADLGELEDVVASIPVEGYAGNAQGYHDPSPQTTHLRMISFYRDAAKRMLRSSFQGRERMVFHGHFRYYDWAKRAPRLLPPHSNWKESLPQFVRTLYQITPPPTTQQLLENGGIPTVTIVRSPIERLASMYYFDRHSTRSSEWREEFVARNGNATLEECLADLDCISKNELRRWCSLQTEMICGVEPECRRRPLDREALETAKNNVRDEIMFVGTTERMDESVRVLEHLLPTYLEGLGGVGSVREKVGNVARREQTFSAKSIKVLRDICSLDIELYNYVDKLLSERIRECGPL